MNGWILKTLFPNIYGKHNWVYFSNMHYTIQYYPGGPNIKLRVYKCHICDQYISIRVSKPRLMEINIKPLIECTEAVMQNALE